LEGVDTKEQAAANNANNANTTQRQALAIIELTGSAPPRRGSRDAAINDLALPVIIR
jgi:hypothetical protein